MIDTFLTVTEYAAPTQDSVLRLNKQGRPDETDVCPSSASRAARSSAHADAESPDWQIGIVGSTPLINEMPLFKLLDSKAQMT